nr:hypothetical protein [Tanacetum cinerariifolium]
MSSDNAQSVVTYMSISSDSDGPSWGIPLMNAGEFSEIDPYEEVAQQGHVHPLSPAYVLDLMELDEHVPVHVPDPEHPEYHAPSNDDIQVEDNDEDSEEDPNKEHEPKDDDEDPEEDPIEEHEPKDSAETKPFEEDETAVTPPPPRHRGARISVRPQTPMSTSTQALIDAFATGSSLFLLPPTSPAYDQAPLGHRTAMICRRDDIPEEDMPPQRRFAFTAPLSGCDVAESSAAARAPRSQYDFVDTVEAGYGLIRSLGQDAWTIAKLLTGKESKYFYTQLYDAQIDCKDIRLEIDVVRGQRTAYEIELHECQSAEDLAVAQMIRIHALEARARTDTVEDADISWTEGVVGLSQWLKKMESVFHISGCAIDNKVKFATCTLLGVALTWWNGHVKTLGHEAAYAMTWGTLKKKMTDKYCPKGKIKKLEIKLWNLRVKGNDVAAYTHRFQELALACTKFLVDETEKVNKYINGFPDNIHGSRQNENKRKTGDSSRNNQQQPQKMQNVARAYTTGPGEKKVYTGDLPLCTKCNYHHTRQCVPKCGKCKRYGHTTTDCQNHGNGNGNGLAQGRAYALGGRDAIPDSNDITDTFLLKNCYAKILFDTGADMSFVSTTFSVLINIISTTLENHYNVELADRKIIGVNTIIRGCTLNFMNHPFNVDLTPVPLGSFDVIIGMDWLTKYHGVIICEEKIVRVPFGRDMLIFQGNRDNQREES